MSDQEENRHPLRRADDFVPSKLPPKITEKAVTTGRELRNQLRVLIALTFFLYIGFGLLIWWTWDQSNTNTKALCAISHEAQKRVAEGQVYLQTHPKGIFGLTSTQIQQSISDSVSTVNALKVVNC